MKYYIKSKFFKIKEDFWVKNEYGEEVFFVDNKFLTFGLQFDIKKNNKIIYSVKEKILTFLSNYNLYENNNIIASVNQKFTFLKDKIVITSSKYDDIVIKGDLFSINYEILQNNRIIATVKKELFSFTDSYYADIDFEDDAFILCLIVIIDNIIDKHNNLTINT